jgi:drug/metabolite transporter (DMT)-like permease
MVAAVFHATWNVLLKSSGDPLLTTARAVTSSALLVAPLGAALWLFSGRPGLPAEAWLLAILSTLFELAYFTFLSEAYRRGELSAVYPLARGSAPVFAVLAGLVLLHESLSLTEYAGVACMLLGLWAVRRPAGGSAAVVPATLTGLCIATYSAIDSVGVHLVPPWLYAWVLWSLTAILLAGWVWTGTAARVHEVVVSRKHASELSCSPAVELDWPRSVLVGLLMTLTYTIVLFALRLAPLTIVVPVRESAILLVAGWGIWRLRETGGAWLRLGGAVGIVAGVALLALR